MATNGEAGDGVRIVAFELENVKRVHVVAMVPDPVGLTVIGGRNAQGKTSVLDGLMWALGGDKMRPDAPNRDGAASPARLRVELSNGLVVERKGKNGSLYVTDPQGMRGGQQLLNAFVSQLALDLPRFMECTDRQRADYLLGILGVDDELARIDREIKATFDERRYVGKDADRSRKVAEAAPFYPDAPDEPVSVADLTDSLQAAMEANAANQRKRDALARLELTTSNAAKAVEALRAELERAEAQLAAYDAQLDDERVHSVTWQDVDTTPIEAAIHSAEEVNAKVALNRERAKAVAEADTLTARYEAMTEQLDGLRAARTKLLDDAGMPLPGLSVEDGTLYYRGHVWSDMSGAEQLRVATAIARATKPECGFVLVDKLEQFDPVELAAFAEWCESEGLQVIGTRVAVDDTCTVVIEDGRIVGQEIQETPTPDPRGEALSWGDEF